MCGPEPRSVPGRNLFEDGRQSSPRPVAGPRMRWRSRRASGQAGGMASAFQRDSSVVADETVPGRFLALVCLCDTMPGAVAERMGQPIDHQWYGPSADLTVHLTGTARSEYLLMRNFARRAGDGYASLEIELWDPTEGLVAYGTQTMIFTFSNGIPEGNDRFPIDVRRRLAAEG